MERREVLTYKKVLQIFANYCWKVFLAVGAICTVFSFVISEIVVKYLLSYIGIVLFLTILISLILLIYNLIKLDISDKTNIYVPNQLLEIVSKLSKEESEILSDAIDRYFHLYGYHEERIKLGDLLNENRDVKVQVSNFINQLGWAKYLNKQTDVAVENIKYGIELAKNNLLFYWAAKGERHLAGIERHRRNESAYYEHYENSKRYTEQIQDINQKSEMEGSLHLSKAKYLLEIGNNLSDAENEANEAMEIFKEDMRRQIKVYVVLGNIHFERREWEKAYNTFKEGYDKSKDIRMDERAKNALGLAKIHIKSDVARFFKVEKAKEYLREAESLKSSLKQHEINEIETLLNGFCDK